MSLEPWVFRGISYWSVGDLRRALQAFMTEPDAASLLEEDTDSQVCIIHCFLNHYQGDPESRTPPGVEEIYGVTVAPHPKWGSPSFALLVGEEGLLHPFSVKKLKTTPSPAGNEPGRRPQITPGQARRKLVEALRAGVEDLLKTWEEENPVPETCPVTGLRMGPLTHRFDPVLRYSPEAPTIDHHSPTFQDRIRTFLEREGLEVQQVPLRKDPERQGWILADPAMLARWQECHGDKGLRWLSLAANRLENRSQQAAQRRTGAE